jgi:hypothetical protein
VDKKRDFWKESVFHRRGFPAGAQKTYEIAAMNWFNSCSLLQQNHSPPQPRLSSPAAAALY